MDDVLTTPAFAERGGFRNLNEFSWFLVKHPEIKGLRRKVGQAWTWPASAVTEVKRLRAEAQKGWVAR